MRLCDGTTAIISHLSQDYLPSQQPIQVSSWGWLLLVGHLPVWQVMGGQRKSLVSVR